MTFDGINKLILLDSAALGLPDLYSRWKDWAATGSNSRYAVAFKTVGGDIPAIPLYLFLENGWRVKPMSANHTLTVNDGVLEVTGGGDPFVDPAGSYIVRIVRQAPGIAIGYSTTGISGPSAADIAAAVYALSQVMPFHANVTHNVGIEMTGTGVPPTYANQPTVLDPGDPFRPKVA